MLVYRALVAARTIACTPDWWMPNILDSNGIQLGPGSMTNERYGQGTQQSVRICSCLVHPAALARESGWRGATPCSAGFLGDKDAGAAAEAAAHFDDRDERLGVRGVESRNPEEAHVRDRFVAPAPDRILKVGFETRLDDGGFAARDDLVTLGDDELRLPEMALAIGVDKGIGHRVLVGRRGLEATAIHLRNVGDGFCGEDQRLRRWIAIEA